MNLSALQFADIDGSIEALSAANGTFLHTHRLQHDLGKACNRFVAMESTEHPQQSSTAAKNTSTQTLLLEARPLFQNSLLSTEVVITFPDPTVTPYSRSINDFPASFGNPFNEFLIDSGLHYLLHDPVPGYLGDILYQSGTRSTILVSDETNMSDWDKHRIQSVLALLNQGTSGIYSRELTGIPCFLEEHGSPGGRLCNQYMVRQQTNLNRLSHICDRLSVIGKSNFIFSDCPGIAVDAIRSSVPTGFVSSAPREFQWIEETLTSYLKHGSRKRLIKEQRDFLVAMLQEQPKFNYIMNNRSTMRSLINAQFSSMFNQSNTSENARKYNNILTKRFTTSNVNTQHPDKLILCTQHSLRPKNKTSIRLRSGMETRCRKFQKFKESPTRFFADSENALLRALASNKINNE